MNWDAEVESPATIAIIGAGHVGIEAAIYARFLGYEIMLFDSGRPGRTAKRQYRRSLNQTVEQLTTPLGWAALTAQDESLSRPSLDKVWTGEEFESNYLNPLAKTDLLHDHVMFNTRVTTVGRLSHHANELDDLQERCNDEFYLVVDSRHRGVYTARADVVIDCRGITGKPQGLGPGGTMAIGQTECKEQWLRYLPLDDRFESRHFEQKKTLVVGTQNVSQQFIKEFHSIDWRANAKLFWLVRPHEINDAEECLRSYSQSQTKIALQTSVLNGYGLVEMNVVENAFKVKVLLADESTNEMSFDHIFVSDEPTFDDSIINNSLFIQRNLINSNLPIAATNSESLLFTTTEPHYYVIRPTELAGRSSYKAATDQIRQLFALLGGRNDLDLYSIVSQPS